MKLGQIHFMLNIICTVVLLAWLLTSLRDIQTIEPAQAPKCYEHYQVLLSTGLLRGQFAVYHQFQPMRCPPALSEAASK